MIDVSLMLERVNIMGFLEILKVILLGIVEGITEWLPISSTGHMVLVDEFIKLDVKPEFMKLFIVVIQLGAILAVVVLYWKKLWPFTLKKEEHYIKKDIWMLWFKIFVACVPAGIIALIFEDEIDAVLNNSVVIAIALIVYGILFIVIERWNKGRIPKITKISAITFQTAAMIGIFQVLAMIPGTSRSGATIVGAMIIGTSRLVAAEFTFYLAIPIMFGASFVKLISYDFALSGTEIGVLILGMSTAYVVSVLAIRFLMGYIKKRDFTAFGWYRIVLGILILGYFLVL